MCYLISNPHSVVNDKTLLNTVLKYRGSIIKGEGQRADLSAVSHVGVCYTDKGQQLVALPLNTDELCFRIHPIVVREGFPRIDDSIDYGTLDKRRCCSIMPVELISNFNIDSNNKIEYVFSIF